MKQSLKNQNRRDISTLIAVVVLASPQAMPAANIQGDTILGNLFVTDTGVFDNGIDFGANGESSLYWSNALSTTISDIFSAQGSFLWRDSVTTSPSVSFTEKMRLDNTNNLTLYKTDGLAGVVINPADGKVTISNNGANSGIFFGANTTATLKAAANGSAIFPGSASFQGGLVLQGGQLNISSTTASSGSTTGAVVVSGGVGIGKDSWINGIRVGRGNGNFSTNTVLGYRVLNGGVTTAEKNTGVGYESLMRQTAGYHNSAFGVASLHFVTGGGYNSGYGSYSLYSDTHSNNSAVGYAALMWKSTGSNNAALGYQAGRYQAAGSNLTSSSNSIYVGANTRGSNSDNNTIVIGANTNGLGPNSTVLGTPNTTLTRLYGETDTDSLKVRGGAIIEGTVILAQPQGDISMGIYQ